MAATSHTLPYRCSSDSASASSRKSTPRPCSLATARISWISRLPAQARLGLPGQPSQPLWQQLYAWRQQGRTTVDTPAQVGDKQAATGRLVAFDERSGRIVRVDDEQRASARCECTLDTRHIDRPFAVILEVIRPYREAVEAREMLEERITGTWDQRVVAGIGEQFEQQ